MKKFLVSVKQKQLETMDSKNAATNLLKELNERMNQRSSGLYKDLTETFELIGHELSKLRLEITILKNKIKQMENNEKTRNN